MTDALIKDVAFDMIAITSMWALLYNPFMVNAYNFNVYLPVCSTMLGIGVSTFVLIKYI